MVAGLGKDCGFGSSKPVNDTRLLVVDPYLTENIYELCNMLDLCVYVCVYVCVCVHLWPPGVDPAFLMEAGEGGFPATQQR